MNSVLPLDESEEYAETCVECASHGIRTPGVTRRRVIFDKEATSSYWWFCEDCDREGAEYNYKG